MRARWDRTAARTDPHTRAHTHTHRTPHTGLINTDNLLGKYTTERAAHTVAGLCENMYSEAACCARTRSFAPIAHAPGLCVCVYVRVPVVNAIAITKRARLCVKYDLASSQTHRLHTRSAHAI